MSARPIFLFMSLLLFKISVAQSIDSSFSINGKLIPPIALLDFFPNLESGETADSVILNEATDCELTIDSFRMKNDGLLWLFCDTPYRGYIEYSVLKSSAEGVFLVDAIYNGGGSFTEREKLYLKIEKSVLYKVGGM